MVQKLSSPTPRVTTTPAGPADRPARWTPRLVVGTGSGLTALVLALPAVPVVRPAVLLAFWALVPGAVVRYATTRRGPDLAPSAVNAALGLALLAVLSQVALALGLDHPRAWTLGLAVVGVLTVLLPPAPTTPPVPATTPAPSTPTPARAASGDRWSFALLLLAAGAWLVSLGQAHLASVADLGLLSALPPLWYVALLLAVGVTVRAALQPPAGRRASVLVAGLVLLVLVLHATPAVLYGLPRYTWTYKHLGVVDHIARSHDLPRARDIYFNWPGFFSGAHWLAVDTGLAPQTLARWAPPGFELLNAAAVWALVTAFTEDRRRAGLATLLFVVGIWIGQDYFAPQALSYLLSITLVASVVRLRRGGRPRADWLVVGVLWAGIVTSHQLTPVVTFSVLLVLQVVLRWRSWWPLVLLGLGQVAWLVLCWPYLSHSNYPLFSLDPFHGSSSGAAVEYPHATGLVVRNVAVHLLYFGLFAVGLAFAAWRGRRDRVELAVGAAALGPALVLLIQDYGGEGQLRTYLFALPFLALLVAGLVLRARRTTTAAALTVLATLGLFLPAYYGQEQVNRVVPADLAALHWFYDHGAPGSEPIFLAPNSPARMTAQYLEHPLQADASPDLLSDPTFAHEQTAAAAVGYLQKRPRQSYLIVTPSQIAFTTYFGVLSPAGYAALRTDLDRDAGLRLVYRDDGASVWQVQRR